MGDRPIEVDDNWQEANLFRILMPRWSTETHTFVMASGGFGPSLEDVATLTSLPMFDETHVASLYPNGETKKRIDALQATLLK